MDFSKFMWIMENSALYLPSISQFNDAHEGVFTRVDYGTLIKHYGKEEGPDLIRKVADWIRQNSTASCWHISGEESSVMWDAYSGLSSGIAIRTTSGRLHKAIEVPEGAEVTYGAIRYLDYEKGDTGLLSWTVPALYKRTLFQSEKEFRVIFKEVDKKPFDQCKVFNQVCVDLRLLIEGVFVSPNAEPWFMNLVSGILAKHCLDHIRVTNSATQQEARWMKDGNYAETTTTTTTTPSGL